MYQIITLHPLNLHNLVSQLHLHQTGEGGVSIMRKPREPQQSIVELLKTQDKKQFYKQPGEKKYITYKGKIKLSLISHKRQCKQEENKMTSLNC